eukprot:EG_transcript_29540
MAFSMAVANLNEMPGRSQAGDNDDVLSWGSENDSDGTEWEELECASTASSYEVLSDHGEPSAASPSRERSKSGPDGSEGSGPAHGFVAPAPRTAFEHRHPPVAFYTLRCGPHAMAHASRFGRRQPFQVHWPHWPLVVQPVTAAPMTQ